MKLSFKILISVFFMALLLSGCAQKVRIKALNPAEVGEMAKKKKVAISEFRNDDLGLSGKIESQIASQKLDRKRYFTIVSRRDIDSILAEQELQSSELMDEKTATRVGKLIGAQALINGEVISSNVHFAKYYVDQQKCIEYVKKKGCVKYRYYKKMCKTMQATVSANINIINVETASLIYGESITKEYGGDSCRRRLLSKTQALNRLTSSIASSFVYQLTPHYIYFHVGLIEDIELDDVTDAQEDTFENSLAFIKAGRMDKAERMLQSLLDELDGRSYVVAYTYGVVNEAQGKFDEARRIYYMADDLTTKPVDELNLALTRIDNLIANRDEAREQINAN